MARARHVPLINRINFRMPKRRVNGKVIVGHTYRYEGTLIPHISYSEFKDKMIKDILEGKYGNMRVNSEGFPKTNTNEPRYAHLRKMIKEGYIILKRTNSISRYSNSAHTYMVLNKDKLNDK